METKDVLLLLLSIPISLLVNLITPQVQRLLAKFNTDRREKLERRESNKRQMWEWLARNPPIFTLYLVRSSLAMLRNIIGTTAALGGFLWLISGSPTSSIESSTRNGLAGAIYIFAVFMMAKIRRHSYDLQYAWVMVRNINKWPADFYFKPLPENFKSEPQKSSRRKSSRKAAEVERKARTAPLD